MKECTARPAWLPGMLALVLELLGREASGSLSSLLGVCSWCFAAKAAESGLRCMPGRFKQTLRCDIFFHLVVNRLQTNVYGPVPKKMGPRFAKVGLAATDCAARIGRAILVYTWRLGRIYVASRPVPAQVPDDRPHTRWRAIQRPQPRNTQSPATPLTGRTSFSDRERVSAWD